jgi:Fe-S oxidoreductase
MISAGLLEDAIRTADRGLRRLGPMVESDDVLAVLVLEPSCLSAMTDEWLRLKVTTPREVRERLAKKAMLVEEFVAKRWEDHPVRLRVVEDGATERVILHGHCHQKALRGVETSAGALRRVFGDRLMVLDSGCCGMAGSFGHTAGHYELSMRIGELSVFGPIREAGEMAAIAAPGTSCRQQIRDGTGRRAVHPVELLEARLRGG